MKDPRLGYAKTFLRQMEENLGWRWTGRQDRHQCRWAEPRRPRGALREIAERLG